MCDILRKAIEELDTTVDTSAGSIAAEEPHMPYVIQSKEHNISTEVEGHNFNIAFLKEKRINLPRRLVEYKVNSICYII